MYRSLCLIISILLVSHCFGVVFAEIYVDDDSPNDPGHHDMTVSDPNENGTLEHPYDSIQEAVDIAGPGSMIILEEGTYIEDIVIDGKQLDISSKEPNNPVVLNTVVHGTGSDSVIIIADSAIQLNGVTIENGLAEQGGGINCTNSQLTLTRCIIKDNEAVSAGGGIYAVDSEMDLSDCKISDNRTSDGPDMPSGTMSSGGPGGHGAGISVSDCNDLAINNSEIINNSTGKGGDSDGTGTSGGAGGSGGGLYVKDVDNVTIKDCDFRNNQTGRGGSGYFGGTGGSGAGFYCKSDTLLVEKSYFTHNRCGDRGLGESGGGGFGGAIFTLSSDSTIVESQFFENMAGAGQYPGQPDEGFAGNSGSGGAISSGRLWVYNNDQTKLELVNCEFVNNITNYYEGNMCLQGYGGAVNGDVVIAENCLFENNEAFWLGGAIYARDITIKNTLFAVNSTVMANGGAINAGNVAAERSRFQDNRAGTFGGAISIGTGQSVIDRCTFALNEAATGSTIFFEGDAEAVIRNSVVNDKFLLFSNSDEPDPSYASVSPLLDIEYSNVYGGWPGSGNIDIDPLFADPNNGDFHLKSEYGRWSPDLKMWVFDGVTSGCIDAGDPNDPNWMGETWPHGQRLNMGCYAGTSEASLSGSGAGLSCDYNRDEFVNLLDFAELADQWSGDAHYTIPHGQVVVDANLTEWAQDVQWVEFSEVYNGNPQDVSHGLFALQWNEAENKIFAAVLVKDTDHVLTDEYTTWDAGDRLEVYCQGDAEGDTSWWNGVWDIAQQYMVGLDTQAGFWATFGLGEAIDSSAGFEVAVRAVDDYIVYEIGVTPFDHYGQFSGEGTVETDLELGHTLGFDLVLDTRHSGGFGMMSENTMTQKFKYAERFAQYTLTDSISRPSCLDLTADTDRNCIVDIRELATFCTEWLQE